MSEGAEAAKFLLAGNLPTVFAVDRIAHWDELTEPGKGWTALHEAWERELMKARPRQNVVNALETAMGFAGDPTHPANLRRARA